MLIGHHKQRQYIRTLAQSGKLPHALLFAGERGLGKKTAALEFAMALNCQNTTAGQKPCFVCRACSDIQKNQYPDLAIVEPEKKEIQISQTRDLIWRLSLRPYNSVLKIAVIDDAHLMNSEAQNCLLKTLEEPSGQALLILISDQPSTLLSTILSRVEKINFYPVAKKEIETVLVSQGASADLARELGELSMGRPGEAIDFFREPEKLKTYRQRLSEVSRLIGDDFTERFQYA
ncbi:MAG: DNA polymerase III subunit delta', partial [Patescibacteria group bacterium]